MSHVVVNGPASWNTVVRLADLPEPSPNTVAATGYHDGLGGTSAGKAVTLAALGLPTTLVTTLGDDEAATRVLCALRAGRHGDRLRVVARHAVAGGTERHVNLVSDDGERVSLYLEQPSAPPPDEQVVELVKTAKAAVLDLAESSRPLLEVARSAGVPLWCDVHDDDGVAEYPRAFVASADVLVVSATRLTDPGAYLSAAVAGGASLAVATRGADGAIARDVDGWWEVGVADAGPVRATEGAGDAFLAGLLHGTLTGAPRAQALARAAATAALALTEPDVGAPHVDLERVERLARQVVVTRPA